MNDTVTRIAETLNPTDGDAFAPRRGAPSTAAVRGHPIHPMIVPYPIAALTGVVATDLLARTSGDPFWARASKLLLSFGLAAGAVAGAVGAIDYYTIRRAREATNAGLPTGKIHAYGNPAALALTALNLAGRGRGKPSAGATLLSTAVAGLLGVTAWAGGELSYRHMVGVGGDDDQLDHREKQYAA